MVPKTAGTRFAIKASNIVTSVAGLKPGSGEWSKIDNPGNDEGRLHGLTPNAVCHNYRETMPSEDEACKSQINHKPILQYLSTPTV